jgi:hypothetical protein
MTIQTAIPTEIPTSISGTEGEFTSACLEVCVVEPCTQCTHLRQPMAATVLTSHRSSDEPAGD